MSKHDDEHSIGRVLMRFGAIKEHELETAVAEQEALRKLRTDVMLGEVLSTLYPESVTPQTVVDALRHQRAHRTRRTTDVVSDARALAEQTQQLAAGVLRGKDK